MKILKLALISAATIAVIWAFLYVAALMVLSCGGCLSNG
jgi:hypothetical protein